MATSHEFLVTSPQFLGALATSWSQFQTLFMAGMMIIIMMMMMFRIIKSNGQSCTTVNNNSVCSDPFFHHCKWRFSIYCSLISKLQRQCSTFRKKSWGQLAPKFSFLVARTSILVAKNYI